MYVSVNQLALNHLKVWPIGYLQMIAGFETNILSQSPQILLFGKLNY